MRNLTLACGFLLTLLLCSGCHSQENSKNAPSSTAQAEMETNKQQMMQNMQKDPKLDPNKANGVSAPAGAAQGGPMQGGAGMSNAPFPAGTR